jgi:hypothetical protein
MKKPSSRTCPRSLSRRGFLLGTGAGLLAGIPAGVLGWRSLQSNGWVNDAHVVSAAKPAASPLAMPGLFPARVVEVHHPGAVNEQHQIDRSAVRVMMDRGMCGLTGADHPHEAWKRLFAADDVIGIKVNPVGQRRNRRDAIESISNKEVVLETVRNLKQIGVPGRNIVLFERYAREFVEAGYADLLSEREMDGVRWCASGAAYTDDQIAINGVENPAAHSPELLRHVVGYDPDCFVHMGFAHDSHNQKDDRRFRSHLSGIVSRLVNKIITLPVLKDHRSSGVTLSLKNMSHGMNNNVARSHLVHIEHGYSDSPAHGVSGPNQCNTFIPTAVNQPLLKEKATLHILDGLIGVFEGGPQMKNKTWSTWRCNSLLFATDPVALDHVGWDIIDSKRVREGLPRVGEMSKYLYSDARKAAMALAGLGAAGLPDALTLLASERYVRGGGDTEDLDRRQPEHIVLAGLIGLGEFDLKKVAHVRERIGPVCRVGARSAPRTSKTFS